ncbi:hypothetical protein [Nannocystis sp.]|uniref:hypothetical protein n=1 Tax=Nannocystis sp. TaxID=1962667 RepID=UPI0025EEFD79|nr:hypothetical protein [Nannocystis sp.]MBK7827409.1 hypothetical protein [Nannocystis sp.]
MRPRAARIHLLSLGLALAACTDKGTLPADTASTRAAGDDVSDTTPTSSPTSGPTGDTTGVPTGDTSTGEAASTSGQASTSDATSATGDPPGELLCPVAIDDAILACIAELQADPELADNNFLLDLLWMCSDAEPVADDYDAHCAAHPDDPICALEYQVFVETVLPECVARVQQLVFADVCLLPATYPELLFAPAIALMERRFVTTAAQLDASEQQQLLWASADMGFPAASVEEALLASDDDGLEQLTVLDVGTDRTLVLYSGHYGDTRVGRMFFAGTLTLVGAVEDGSFTRCGVERTIEGQPCTDDLACAPDHKCIDILSDADNVVLAPGVCASPTPIAGEGSPCNAHQDCDPSSGLLCLDSINEGDDGVCRPGWMRRSFAGPDTALVAGGSVKLPLLVAGVATVPTAAYLDLQRAQDGANQVAIHLVNPLGTSTSVSLTDAPLVVLDLEPIAVPTDESAGGVWHLVVDDLGGQASGAVTRVALTLDTRWD